MFYHVTSLGCSLTVTTRSGKSNDGTSTSQGSLCTSINMFYNVTSLGHSLTVTKSRKTGTTNDGIY